MLNETKHISGSVPKVIALVSMLVDHLAAFAWNGLASLELGIGADDDFFKSLEPDESLSLQIRRK